MLTFCAVTADGALFCIGGPDNVVSASWTGLLFLSCFHKIISFQSLKWQVVYFDFLSKKIDPYHTLVADNF